MISVGKQRQHGLVLWHQVCLQLLIVILNDLLERLEELIMVGWELAFVRTADVLPSSASSRRDLLPKLALGKNLFAHPSERCVELSELPLAEAQSALCNELLD